MQAILIMNPKFLCHMHVFVAEIIYSRFDIKIEVSGRMGLRLLKRYLSTPFTRLEYCMQCGGVKLY